MNRRTSLMMTILHCYLLPLHGIVGSLEHTVCKSVKYCDSAKCKEKYDMHQIQ